MKITQNRGSALLLVMIAMLILSLIGLSALTQSGSEINTTGNFYKDKSAFYAADAGIQVGLDEIQKQFTNPTGVLLDKNFGNQRYYTGTMTDTSAQYVKAFMGFKAPPIVGQSADMGGELNMQAVPWQLTVTAVSKAGTKNQIRKQLQTVVITMVPEY
ncbi:MAG: pilus assembly PilX N-terminal domain-containing protein [Candidatus Aminicenantes bacterium]|nr:pilus assembly PilX N-terminal domain-containing protein [Candidatus Aminicenantes bacterium]